METDNKKSYKNLLIVGIAESEQNRRTYETSFINELKNLGIEAETSYKLIKNGEKIDRDTLAKATRGLGMDGVIVTHLVAVDEETVYRPGVGYGYNSGYVDVGYGGGYYGSMYSYYPHVNAYVHNLGYYDTLEIYTLETNLYDIESEELVWSARSRTFAPESVQEVIVDVIKLLVKDLENKKLIIEVP
ncbi:hypothetical protein MNBD_GAMMA06-1805 [hydrothermal vent metagenome]|uniref:Uncharacterized protein n=1 Tax=hydrothermal vent metagenome TaxID=652676 RepID=A0A3B0XEB5_9ZZZZ